MAEILQFVRSRESLDPEALSILGAAYDRAIAALRSEYTSKLVCETIADRIIDAGRRGERDPDTLHKLALRAI